MNAAARNQVGGGFPHLAFQYRGPDDYVAGVGEFVLDGLADGAAVLIAVPGPQADTLRDRLSGEARPDGAVFVDMAVLGRNPGRILSYLRSFVADRARQPVRIVGEPIWPGRTPAEIVEATRHEALINLAFAGTPSTVLCPYDVSRLPAAVVAGSERTHPTLLLGGGFVPSPSYTPPLEVSAGCDRSPWEEPRNAHGVALTAARLAELRGRVADLAIRSGAPPERVRDFVGAVNEAAEDVLRRRREGSRVRFWRDTAAVLVEIAGVGPWDDPLTGRVPPAPDADEALGLWLIQQVCDLVETRAAHEGFTLRLHLDLPAPIGTA